MDDFIFGALATVEQRLEHVRRLRSGITHNHARTPRDPLPGQPITLHLTIGPAHTFDRAWVYWTDDGSDPEGEDGVARRGYATPMEADGAEWDTLLWGYVRRLRATLPPQPAGTLLRYRIAAALLRPPSSVVGHSAPVLRPSSFVKTYADDGAYYACYVADDPPPAWAQDAIVYQIFVDRFNPGGGRPFSTPLLAGESRGGGADLSGFFGGTLRGVTEKLDYISSLGANVLWLTPIFPSPSHHGYDATDYFDVEPRLGTKTDLRELLDAAHARNIRVLLDFVPNHWSSRHPTFQQATSAPDSPYRDWYTFHHWPDKYESFFGVKSLPQLNLRNFAARQHMLDAAAYWLDFGVDGYRVDYAIGPTPDFWADFRHATRAVTRQHNPDCWTFGEVVEPSDRQLTFEGLLDGCLDFVLLEAFRRVFAFGRWDAVRFADFLDRHEAFFPSSFSRPSFLDNHDMNRFLWAAGSSVDRELALRRLKLAALCQFTLAGPPVIYYGTEVGLSQERDVRQGSRGVPEEARLPMLWDSAQDTDLLAFYRDLAALRHSHPVLRRGTRQLLHVDAETLAYTRSLDSATLTMALNLAAQPRRLSLPGAGNALVFSTDPACVLESQAGETTVHLTAGAGVVVN